MNQELIKWLEDLQDFRQAEWDKLPDIGLYMDQVQTYIERQLSLFAKSDSEKLLTPAMINNYIKDSLIPRAESKKYSPSHLALLMMIATLKQVQPMQNLKLLLADKRETPEVRQLYEEYLDKQQQDLLLAAADILAEIKACPDSVDQEEFMRQLALSLSIEARNRILLSERILLNLVQIKSERSVDEAAAKEKTDGRKNDNKKNDAKKSGKKSDSSKKDDKNQKD